MSQTLLLVDDNAANLKILGQLVRSLGHEAILAMNGQDALESTMEIPPDLILLDINMPLMDGYETCRRLKANPKPAQIPVIFTSSLSEEFSKKLAFDLGAVDYLVKPLMLSEAKSRITTHLSLSIQRLELVRKAEESTRQVQALQNLLQNMSHDLANPLTTIHMSAEIALMKPGVDAKPKLESIKRSAEIAISLIRSVRQQQMADRSASEPGDRPKTPLAEAVQEAWMQTTHLGETKGILLEARCPGEILAACDRGNLVLTVLGNLFSNAIKFSHPGGTVELQAAHEGDKILMTVADRGCGMSEEDVAAFNQGQRCKSRPGTCGEAGSGFGLGLLHSTVARFGGSIRVDRREGGGTVFTIHLPAG